MDERAHRGHVRAGRSGWHHVWHHVWLINIFSPMSCMSDDFRMRDRTIYEERTGTARDFAPVMSEEQEPTDRVLGRACPNRR